jgi:hypothetical protein
MTESIPYTQAQAADEHLAHLIGMEDALMFMERNFTRDDHVTCYKLETRAQAGIDWDAARQLVRELKTVRNAYNHVQRVIDKYR